MNRFIYHYCAKYQTASGNTAIYDGIAQLEKRIIQHEQYGELKKRIDADNAHKLSITSLTFLGMEHEQPPKQSQLVGCGDGETWLVP